MKEASLFSQEQLRESVESLTQKNYRERRRRINTELILEGNHKLSLASTPEDVYRIFLKLLGQFFDYQHVLVLTRLKGKSRWELVYGDSYQKVVLWQDGALTPRLLKGNVSVIFDSSKISEFSPLPEDYRKQHYSSVIACGLSCEMSEWLLLLGHCEEGHFGQDHRHLCLRLLPLLRQRLLNLEYQDQLKMMVAQRTDELRHSEQRFMSFAQTASDWFWETDVNYRFTFISSGLGERGKPVYGNLIGRSLLTLNARSSSGMSLQSLLAEQCSLRNILFTLEESEPPVFWGALSGEPFYDAQEQFAGYRGSVRDMTQERADRRALRKAKEEAERANHAKSDFLAMMSHEIRTPMNAIVGMVELLKEEILNDTAQELLTNAARASGLLLNIINDVLDISKLEAGVLQLEKQRFCVRDIVEQVLGQLQESARVKGLNLTSELDDCCGDFVLGDAYRLAQILLNLVSNGIKFTQSGSVSVTVRGQVQDNVSHLIFTIQDTGIGIHPDDFHRLFEPFHQLSQSHARLYGGTGLGLSIVKKLVDAMSGELHVQSQPDQGALFTVCLQFPIVAPDISAPETLLEHPEIEPLEILVVEDSPSNQLVIRLMLEKLGHRVVIAEDGDQALRCERLSQFDLILMDLQMPGIDGFQTMYRMRDQGIRCPIVALTANIQERERCTQAGMDDFLSKPLTREALLALFKRIMQHKQDHSA
ncbi:ATP-binding protein [Celerinatantimonas sp. YJH-8]|uniref:ATP-binding protein n=1 Tax=Celerinatantimonas sp. YJH-8 TaxID=3228714 RepID=UPI0038C1A9FE